MEEPCGEGWKCMHKKTADEHPQYKWIVTKAGLELDMDWPSVGATSNKQNAIKIWFACKSSTIIVDTGQWR